MDRQERKAGSCPSVEESLTRGAQAFFFCVMSDTRAPLGGGAQKKEGRASVCPAVQLPCCCAPLVVHGDAPWCDGEERHFVIGLHGGHQGVVLAHRHPLHTVDAFLATGRERQKRGAGEALEKGGRGFGGGRVKERG